MRDAGKLKIEKGRSERRWGILNLTHRTVREVLGGLAGTKQGGERGGRQLTFVVRTWKEEIIHTKGNRKEWGRLPIITSILRYVGDGRVFKKCKFLDLQFPTQENSKQLNMSHFY